STDERGTYTFPDLNSGTYQVNAMLPGFKTETASDVRVSMRSNIRQDLRLQVASVAEAVNVMAARPMRLNGVLGGVLPAAAPVNGRALGAIAVEEKAAFNFDAAAPPPMDDFRQQQPVLQGQADAQGGVRDFRLRADVA